ncbi:glycosyl hydrolase family 28 protein [Thermophilibacter sp.]
MSRTTITVPSELGHTDRLVTAELQAVLDAARDAGGARATFEAGTYRTGSLRLYGSTELYLKSGARIQGSDDIADYTDWDIPTTLAYATNPDIVRIQGLCPHYTRALITAADVDNVAITGEPGAAIDGVDCTDPHGEEGFRGAMGIRVCRCRNVTLSGYTFERSANWSHQIDSCDNVLAEGVTVLGGHDGFNIHHCNNVSIRRCTLKCGDDCVAGFDARNVVVEDTLLNTACNALRLGCANLLVEGCRFVGPGEYPHILEGTHHMHAAIKYYAVKGDVIREDACNWRIRDCSFENPGRLINYDYGSERGYQTERPLVDLHLTGCRVSGVSMSSFFRGREDVPGLLELDDCSLEYAPDAESAGRPFVQLGEGARLIERNVTYSCATGEPLSGPREVRKSEVTAEVLKRVQP